MSAQMAAQEWVRQNPFEFLSQMYDIDFDGKHGIAVGADATIFTTTDFGANWIRRKPSGLARTIESAIVISGTMGQRMLAGGDSIIMVSRDGGATWKTSYVEIPNIYKIQELPGDEIVALGKDFGIYSLDNGITWQPFNMPAFGVTAGHFTTIHKGWVALGEPGNVRVWYTQDGGFNWVMRDPQAFELVSYIEMLNDTVGFLASKEFLYKTIDGGFSWWPLNNIATDHIQDLHVINEDNMWASLDNGSIFFSTSGGSDWEQIDPELINSNRTLGIWANTAGKVWIVGKYLSILHSSNWGQDWADQLPANKQTLYKPSFNNVFTGMIGGGDGVVMHTTNGGATWGAIHLPREETFYGTDMVNDSTAIIGSATGNIYKTTNGGRTWSLIGEGLGRVTDLHAFSAQSIIVSNTSGDFNKTIDGGATWNKVFDGGTGINSIDFLSPQIGWAVGSFGRVFSTSDGGNSWTLILNQRHKEFSDAHMTSINEGWVTSASIIDSIWHTTDGGATWEKLLLPYRTHWNGVTFMDRDTGWVVGGTDGIGIILRTNDKGQTWFVDHESPDAFLGVFSIPNSETAWAVGYGGNIMKFSSCGSPPAISDLRGDLQPCAGDTINYELVFSDVDLFSWTFPSDWHVLGNMNTSSIFLITSETPGIITVMGSDACGDSTVQLFADVVPVVTPDIAIHEQNGILMTATTNGFFQWLFNGKPIPGATEPSFKPELNGTYQLHYTTPVAGCEALSNTFVFGIKPTIFIDDDNLEVFPNPSNGVVIVNYQGGGDIPSGSKVILTHIDGRIMMNATLNRSQINVSDLPPGMYSLMIQTEKEIMRKSIIVE